jgi:two-component system, OmpR family, response regulator QseB
MIGPLVRILIVEDDELLGDALKVGLGQLGFQVDWVMDGFAALREVQAQVYEAVVLDLGLPRIDGLDVLAKVRAAGVNTPVCILTARHAVEDRIRGLDHGADDYCVKPVDLNELGARLRALVRRAHGQTDKMLCVADLELDPAARSVTLEGRAVWLSTREFDLLQALMFSAGRVLSREQIEQQLYRWGQDVGSNTVEVHVHHLRRKLRPDLIQTVRGVGYMMPRPPGAE